MDVPEERLELSRDNSQRLLRPQRLPISPSGLFEVGSRKFEVGNLNINSTSTTNNPAATDNKAANIIV